jgi:hypothetical protein
MQFWSLTTDDSFNPLKLESHVSIKQTLQSTVNGPDLRYNNQSVLISYSENRYWGRRTVKVWGTRAEGCHAKLRGLYVCNPVIRTAATVLWKVDKWRMANVVMDMRHNSTPAVTCRNITGYQTDRAFIKYKLHSYRHYQYMFASYDRFSLNFVTTLPYKCRASKAVQGW